MTKEERKALRFKRKSDKFAAKYGVSLEEVYEKLKRTETNSPKEESKTVAHGKVSETKNEFNKIMWSYYKHHIWALIGVALLTLIQIGGTFLLITQFVVDYVTASVWNVAMQLVMCIIVIYCALCGIGYFKSFWLRKISILVVEQIRQDLARQAINTTSGAYKKLTSGEVLQRVNSDPRTLANALQSIWDNVGNVMSQISFIAYFATMHYSIICSMIFILALHFVLTYFQMRRKKVYEKAKAILQEKSNSNVNEFIRGNEDVKGLNIKSNMMAQFSKITGFRRAVNVNSARYTTATNELFGAITQGLTYALIILGIYLTSIGTIGFGALTVLLMYRNAPGQLAFSVSRIWDNATMCGIYAGRMAKLFNDDYYPQERFGTANLDNFSGKVTLKDVSFSYEDKQVLENVSFELKPNQSVGIVGKSGAGKSTILSLINRLNDCDSGQILLDDTPNTDLTETALRTSVALVPQSPYIFNASIRENLLFIKPNATEEELVTVLKQAKLYDFVMSKEKGMDTVVGESGVVLSGGQKQRLALARAFLGNSKVIMLDEATSALDNKTQDGVKLVIDSMKNERSFLIVAHRLSTIQNCDNILVLDEHKIVASGTHEKLMKNCKIYNDLYKLEKE